MLTFIPNTVRKCRDLLGVKKTFQTFVCCTKCNALYEFENCYEKVHGKQVSRRCTHIEYQNHPMAGYRRRCNALLLKEVKIGSKLFHYPFRTYCYKSVIESMKHFLSRKGFSAKCEHWRNREIVQGSLQDVYDGCVWEEFQCFDGRAFLKQENSFGFMMNIDWFQPFKHTQYSVGAIYLVLMNLPRAERFLPENIILCGVIPGPHEPSKHINQFLAMLVKELFQLWTGVYIDVKGVALPIRIRAALLCIASDIPATRKICGFTGHNSTMGCSKCLKQFDVHVGAPSNYSGYNRSTWTPRTNEHHKFYSDKYKLATTRKAREEIERKTGVRYSILTQLPYFDCIRLHVVDPMHNLLLGTAKHMMNTWIESSLLSRNDFDNIQHCVDSFCLPNDVGRIPYRIGSGFSGFKADQWRTWTTVYSLVSLKGILPPPHYNCWALYVRACQILCSRTITIQSVERADDLITEFCTFLLLYMGIAKLHPTCTCIFI